MEDGMETMCTELTTAMLQVEQSNFESEVTGADLEVTGVDLDILIASDETDKNGKINTEFKTMLQDEISNFESEVTSVEVEIIVANDESDKVNLLDTAAQNRSMNNISPLPNPTNVSICGRILRIMGDEQTCRTCGKHLRKMGDEIYYSYEIRNLLTFLNSSSEDLSQTRNGVVHRQL